MRVGNKVKLKGRTGLSGYGFYKKLTGIIKKQGYVTIDYIKPSGGIILREIDLGENMFGVEKGILPHHLVLAKKRKPAKKKKGANKK